MADACDPVPSKPAGNTSGRKVMCKKLQKELPGLDAPPWPGELGQRIYENISAQAWKLWEDRMKMILNEYRLMPWQKEAQDLVAKHMEDFFFGKARRSLRSTYPAVEVTPAPVHHEDTKPRRIRSEKDLRVLRVFVIAGAQISVALKAG